MNSPTGGDTNYCGQEPTNGNENGENDTGDTSSSGTTGTGSENGSSTGTDGSDNGDSGTTGTGDTSTGNTTGTGSGDASSGGGGTTSGNCDSGADTYTGNDYQIQNQQAILLNPKLVDLVDRHRPQVGVPQIDLLNLSNNQANVIRVMKVCDQSCWDYLFPMRNTVYQYLEFLKAIWKYPLFCNQTNESGMTLDQTCRKELATIFAHYAQETGKHDPSSQSIPEWRQGLFYLNEIGCHSGGNCQYFDYFNKFYPVHDGVSYHGRGAKQLSWNYNYGQFSVAYFNDKNVLLRNPDRVAEEGWLALGSSIWFYMTPQAPKPSMHDVVTRFWVPNCTDLQSKNYWGFGSTINIVNGAMECGFSSAQAANRVEYYKKLMEYFGVPLSGDEVLDCLASNQFNSGGSGSLKAYWYQDWSDSSKCHLVSWWSAFSIYEPRGNGYKRCVDYFAGETGTGDTTRGTGSTGTTGGTGSTGDTGTTGGTGNTGDTGDTGDSGTTGSSGGGETTGSNDTTGGSGTSSNGNTSDENSNTGSDGTTGGSDATGESNESMDFSIPDCLSYELLAWVAKDPSYKYGVIRKHKGRRYVCRVEVRCNVAAYEPGTYYGKEVWTVLKSNEAVDLTPTDQDYVENGSYMTGDTVVFNQFTWKCVSHPNFCSSRTYHPMGLYGDSVWKKVKLNESTLTCNDTSDSGSANGSSEGDASGNGDGSNGTDNNNESGENNETENGNTTGDTSGNGGTGESGNTGDTGSSGGDNTTGDNGSTGGTGDTGGDNTTEDNGNTGGTNDTGNTGDSNNSGNTDSTGGSNETGGTGNTGDNNGTEDNGNTGDSTNTGGTGDGDNSNTGDGNNAGDSTTEGKNNSECGTSDNSNNDDYYAKGKDSAGSGDESIPDCLGYCLKKWKIEETDIKFGDIRYHDGKRYYCHVKGWCQQPTAFTPGDGSIAWTVLKNTEVLDLSKDTYDSANLSDYTKDTEVVMHGKRFKCLQAGWCVLTDYAPVGNHGTQAWEMKEDLSPTPSSCSDSNTGGTGDSGETTDNGNTSGSGDSSNTDDSTGSGDSNNTGGTSGTGDNSGNEGTTGTGNTTGTGETTGTGDTTGETSGNGGTTGTGDTSGNGGTTDSGDTTNTGDNSNEGGDSNNGNSSENQICDKTDVASINKNDYYVKGVDSSATGDESIPDCLGYYLKKWTNSETDVKFGDIRYHSGKRYYCHVQGWCQQSTSFAPGDGSIAWKVLKNNQVLDLCSDTYDVQNLSDYVKDVEVVMHGKKYKCKVTGWCNLVDYAPVGNHSAQAWELVEDLNPAAASCAVLTARILASAKGPNCVSFDVPEWKANNSEYIIGSLVKWNQEVFRCAHSLKCKFESYRPGRKLHKEAWNLLYENDLQDPSVDDYGANREYEYGDRMVFHQHEFECIGFKWQCSDYEFNPYGQDGGQVWKWLGKVESSLECIGDSIWKNGEKIQKIIFDGISNENRVFSKKK